MEGHLIEGAVFRYNPKPNGGMMRPIHAVPPCTNLLPNLGVYWQHFNDERAAAAREKREVHFTAAQLIERIQRMGPFQEGHYFFAVNRQELAGECARLIAQIDAKGGVLGVSNHWVTHPEFAIVEQAMADVLGHPWHLREVAAGWTKAVSRSQWWAQLAVRTPVGRLLSNPMTAIRKVGEFAKPWVDTQRNKRMVGFPHAHKRNTAHVLMEHRAEFLDPQFDLYSIRDYVPFFSRSIPLEWLLPMAEVFVNVIAVNPLAALVRDAPGAQAHVTDDSTLIIDSERYGSLVWLIPDERGRFSGLWSKEQEVEGALPGILIRRGFHTRCQRPSCDKRHPILEPNQIWQTPAFQLPSSCSLVSWTPKPRHKIMRLLHSVLRRGAQALPATSSSTPRLDVARAEADLELNLSLQAQGSLADLRATTAEGDLRTERAFHEQVGRWLDGRIPSGTLEPVIHGTFKAQRKKMLIVFGDLVKFSLWSETRDSEEVIGKLDRVHQLFRRVVTKYHGVVPKNLGDGFMAYFILDELDISATKEIDDALSALLEVHELLLSQEDMTARFGLHSGSAHIGLIDGVLDIAGVMVNEGARFESLADSGRTVISMDAARLAIQARERSSLSGIEAGHEFVIGKHALRYLGVRVAKHDLPLQLCELVAQDNPAQATWVEQAIASLETSEVPVRDFVTE